MFVFRTFSALFKLFLCYQGRRVPLRFTLAPGYYISRLRRWAFALAILFRAFGASRLALAFIFRAFGASRLPLAFIFRAFGAARLPWLFYFTPSALSCDFCAKLVFIPETIAWHKFMICCAVDT